MGRKGKEVREGFGPPKILVWCLLWTTAP